MAPHCCGFCCRSWWAIMVQYRLQRDTGPEPLLTTALYTHTFSLRHDSLELPCVFQIIVLVLCSIRLEISNIRTALLRFVVNIIHLWTGQVLARRARTDSCKMTLVARRAGIVSLAHCGITNPSPLEAQQLQHPTSISLWLPVLCNYVQIT